MTIQAKISPTSHHQPNYELNFPSIIVQKHFKIRTLREAKELATNLANYCANRTMASLGLTEMLVNAIEHGNLNIDYSLKSRFNNEQEWFDEINRRLLDKENIHKKVEVTLESNPNLTKITIVDQGKGFDWTKHQQPGDKVQLDRNGRGILITKNLAFDELIYYPPGNKVECISYTSRQ